jgi:hypothetical protein
VRFGPFCTLIGLHQFALGLISAWRMSLVSDDVGAVPVPCRGSISGMWSYSMGRRPGTRISACSKVILKKIPD